MSRRDRWVFRVATAPRHGGGHASRCLTLACAMSGFADIRFWTDRQDGPVDALIRQAGFAVEKDTGPALGAVTACLADGYEFDAGTLARLSAGQPLVVLDDLGAPPALAGLAINAGFHMAGETLAGVPALLGPRYALVEAGFRPRRREFGQAGTVLVTMGRTDAAGGTALALTALRHARRQGFAPKIAVALGSSCPHLDAVARLLEDFGGSAQLHVDAADMAGLMAEADIVLGAGGVGLQERVAMGIPSITLIAAANQAQAVAAAVDQGLTAGGWHIDRTTAEDLNAALIALASDTQRRRAMAERGPAVIDGRGPERVAAALKDFGQAGGNGEWRTVPVSG